MGFRVSGGRYTHVRITIHRVSLRMAVVLVFVNPRITTPRVAVAFGLRLNLGLGLGLRSYI